MGKIIINLLLAAILAVSPAEASIRLTPQEEQVAGKGQLLLEQVAYLPDVPALSLMQQNLMRFNKDRLQPYKTDNVRGLHPVHMMLTNKKFVNAYCLAGGHVFLSDAMTVAFLARSYDPVTGETSGMQKRLNDGFELYGHSALAAAMAHEFSHWERNQLQGMVDILIPYLNAAGKQVVYGKLVSGDGAGFIRELTAIAGTRGIKAIREFSYHEEMQADQGAMQLLDNSDVYSPGSLIMVTSRMKDAGQGKDTLMPHPPNAVRQKAVREHIKELSGGRVLLDEASRLRLDGKLFMKTGYLPARADVTAQDRTIFAAGQLAKCIRYQMQTVLPMSTDREYAAAGQMVPLLAVNKQDTFHRTVLDKFAVTQAEARLICEGKGHNKTMEQRAAREITSFLQGR
jgi:hypothetical protein